MNVGMLWEDRQGSLADRVLRAAIYYERKYGRAPTVAFAHPDDAGETRQVGQVAIKKLRRIARGNIWLGVE